MLMYAEQGCSDVVEHRMCGTAMGKPNRLFLSLCLKKPGQSELLQTTLFFDCT